MLRTAAIVAALAGSTVVAVGCGVGGADSDDGALSFVPRDSVGVAVVSLRERDLQRSLDTLGRVPAWGLLEAQMPANDAPGLLEAGIDAALDSDEQTESMSYEKDVEPWLGDEAGVAVLPEAVDEPESLGGDRTPVLAWVDSTDDEAARSFARRSLGTGRRTSEHEGITIWRDAKDETAVFVADGTLVLVSGRAAAERAIDQHESGDDSFADNRDVRELLDARDRREQVATVVRVDRLLDLGSAAAQRAKQADARATSDFLQDDRLRDALPETLAMSTGVDDVGLWIDTSWAPAAEPSIDDARTLVERMPADAVTAAAQSTNSKLVEQLPDVWQAARDAWNLELDTVADRCPQAQRALCDLGVRFAGALLEGDLLERFAAAYGDDGATVIAQRVAVQGSGMPSQRLGVISRVDDPAAMNELYRSGIEQAGPTLRQQGVQLGWQAQGDDGVVTIRLVPGSAAARALGDTPGLPAEFKDLTSRQGMRIPIDTVDDTTQAMAFPAGELPGLLSAWTGDAEQISGNDRYRRDVDAANAPAKTSFFQWADYTTLVVDTVKSLGTDRAVQTMVQNNATHVGGVLTWTERRGDDDRIGVAHTVLPIYD